MAKNRGVDLPRIERAVREILAAVGEDPNREGLLETPARVARMYAEMFSGLHDDPPAAVARAVGLVEATAARHGIPEPVQMTVATTDGTTTWAFRYSSAGSSRSLFHSTDVSTLREQYPDNPVLHELSDDARLVVSEPLGDLQGAWREVPESSYVAIRGATEELHPFAPVAP